MAVEGGGPVNPSTDSPSLVSEAPRAGASLSLDRELTLIGSGTSVRLRLRSAAVSRCHTAIIFDKPGLYLRDLSRRSNTLVNGVPVTEARLHDGDLLAIGQFTFRIRGGSSAGASTPQGGGNRAVIRPTGGDADITVAGRTLLLGRTENCDVRLAGGHVSAAHALIFQFAGKHQIRDLNSRSGIQVNGAAVKQATLSPGDVIGIGEREFRYELLDVEESKPAAEHSPDLRSDELLPPEAPPAASPAEKTKAAARIALGGLEAVYSSGRACHATAVTEPPDLTGVSITYNGSVEAPTEAGRYQVEATLDHPDYAAEPARGLLNIARAKQSIAIDPLPDCTLGDAPFTLAASASSGLRVSFATAGALRTVGARATIVAAGTAWVTATQSGSSNYDPASRTITITVRPAPEAEAEPEVAPPAGERHSSGVTDASTVNRAGDVRPSEEAEIRNRAAKRAEEERPAYAEPVAERPPAAPVGADRGRPENRGSDQTRESPQVIDPLPADSMLRLLPAVFGVGSFEQEMKSLEGPTRSKDLKPQAGAGADESAQAGDLPEQRQPRRWLGRRSAKRKPPG